MGHDSQLVKPAKNILGSLRMPGDKSISHRYGMLAAIAEGKSRFENFSTGADCASTLSCVEALGATIRRDGTTVEIEGRGPALVQPAQPLDCGNSGSTMRMLSGIVAAQAFDCEMFGDESLSRRPMARIIDPLTKMGAVIEAGEKALPPLKIHGRKLRAVDYATPVASAQVKSCVLFAGLLAEGITSVEEPIRTRDHSELALRAFGAEVARDKNRVSIAGGQKLKAIEAVVPGDISSAAFFLCAAALFPESNLMVDGLGLNPTRAVLLDVLFALGAKASMLRVEEQHGELIGTVRLQSGPLRGLKLSGAQTAALIDEVPVLAAIAPFTRDGIEIRDARELRVKESDRIKSIVQNLNSLGAQVEEFEDGLRVPGGQKLKGGRIDSFGDHRIAMAFAVAALRAEGEVEIAGADAARISFPEFYDMLERIIER
jgi:3-phosphoshikimate 1-carboxyvinyltransferase